MGFADLHIHSAHSHDGTCSIPAILKHAADRTDLDVIAITDHDKVSGLREAVALGPKYGIEVVPGCEVSTADGHLLVFFIMNPIPAGLSLTETIKIAGRMGGLCAIPHPEAPMISGVPARAIRAALADGEAAPYLVGIEVYNSGLLFPATNRSAAALGHDLGLACIGASDSHILDTIGEGRTEFEGSTALDLRAALERHATTALARSAIPGAEVLRRWFPQYCLRKMGWVAWSASPQDPIRYARANRAMAGLPVES